MVLESLDFIARLAALVPAPPVHVDTYPWLAPEALLEPLPVAIVVALQ